MNSEAAGSVIGILAGIENSLATQAKPANIWLDPKDERCDPDLARILAKSVSKIFGEPRKFSISDRQTWSATLCEAKVQIDGVELNATIDPGQGRAQLWGSRRYTTELGSVVTSPFQVRSSADFLYAAILQGVVRASFEFSDKVAPGNQSHGLRD